MHLHFVIPDPTSSISGGNRYNHELLKALDLLGVKATITQTLEHIPSGVDAIILDSLYFDDHIDGNAELPGNTVALVHHLSSLYPYDESRLNSYEAPFLRAIGRHIATSPYTREVLIDLGISTERIVVLEPVIPQLARDPVENSKVNAFMLSNIDPRKGTLDFLEHLADRKIQPVYSLLIAGSLDADKDYAMRCQELVRNDKNLSKTVRFLGAQDEAAVERLWQKSNLFISSSYMETFGMSIQEAAERGKALLVLERGSTGRHVASGVNGICALSMSELCNQFEQLVLNNKTFQALSTTAFEHKTDYTRTWSQQASALRDFIARSSF